MDGDAYYATDTDVVSQYWSGWSDVDPYDSVFNVVAYGADPSGVHGSRWGSARR
jgi:hypothetical protein